MAKPSSAQIIQAVAEIELRRRARQNPDDQDAYSLSPGPQESFREWCNRLAANGLKVDGHPFTLATRPALDAIYDLIPTNPLDAYDKTIVLRKGAQMGLTIWEVLADLYMAIKWEPLTIGMYVPDSKLAPYKSTHRFLRLVKSIPELYKRMTHGIGDDGKERRVGDGNVLTRILGDSRFLFLWTSGATMTESFPADVVSFDEVQNMTPGDISKVNERLSASHIKLKLLLSTPKWPDSDIDFWYQQGTQHQFWTRCGSCKESAVLVDYFPERMDEVVLFDNDINDYRYRCPHCGKPIDDVQTGEWRATYPDRTIISYHLSQIISPTVSAGQLVREWQGAKTGEQKTSFYNRKLGRPYADPSKIPVTRTHLNACVEAGKVARIEWKTSSTNAYMGIDQMGGFNAVLIKERLPDGRTALVHAEAIFDSDPFARCDELMNRYGVACCVVEGLPNWNDAKRFSNRHHGRVFVASYGDQTDTQVWGDQIVRTDRKTDAEERDRWTVRLNQYKAMQSSLMKITDESMLFPDPAGLACEYRDGVTRRVLLLNDIIFDHLTRVALISERDPETARWRTYVKKVGLDPHYAYANMLCDVALARAYGGSSITVMKRPEATPLSSLPGLSPVVAQRLSEGDIESTCAGCVSYQNGICEESGYSVRPKDSGCPLFISRDVTA